VAYLACVTGDPAPASAPAGPLLLEHVRPHRRALVAGGLLGLLGGSAALAQPLAAKAVIDALADDASLLRPIGVLTALVVVGALLSAASLFVLERAAEAVVLRARRRLVGRLLRLRVAELDRLAPGDLLSRVTSDTVLLRTVATSSVVDAVTGLLMLVGAIVLMGSSTSRCWASPSACSSSSAGSWPWCCRGSGARWSARRRRSARWAPCSSAPSARCAL
jgi:ABC-type multidrug transport system fused ATPase/permease subunit